MTTIGAKKDEYRFTLQFTSTDPRHLQVAEILNRQGRRKAQYLVNAVLCFENGAATDEIQQPTPDYHMIEAIVNRILAEKTIPENPAKKLFTPQTESRHSKSEEFTFEDAAAELGQDGIAAISNSIAAFRKNE